VAGGRDIKPWLRRSLTAGGEQGFSLALALLVVLGALTTAVAITGRTLTNRQARQQLDAGLTARNAAEIGMTRIIADLNRPRNRRLLVNAPGLGATGATTTTIGTNDDFRSACDLAEGQGPDLSGEGSFNSGALLNNEVTIPNTNSQLHYKLVRIVNGDPAVGSFPDPNLSEQDADGDANTSFRVTLGNGATPVTPGVSGRITLDVTGRAVDADGEESLYHLRKTFAVIPKCCGSSFGGFTSSGDNDLWGNDERTDCGVASGYGLILGSRRDLTNADTRGSLSTLLSVLLERTIGGTTTSSTVNRVYCTVPSATPATTDCPLTSSASIVRTKIRLKDITLPPLPIPSATSNTNTGNYAYTANQATLGSFGTTTQIPQLFRNVANVEGYARMRVCDSGVSTPNPSPWIGASNRTFAAAVLSSSSPRVGCQITASSSETLNTRDFDNWRLSAGNTLKWHLGRLCTRVTWPPSVGVNTIYCNLDQLSISGSTITFDTAGNSANTSVPIILSFPNGNASIRQISQISRSSNTVELTFSSSHNFTTGQSIIVRDLPASCGSTAVGSSINNAPGSTYTVSSVPSSTRIRFTRNGSNFTTTPCGTLTNEGAPWRGGTAVRATPTISDIEPIIASSGLFSSSTIRQINTQRTAPQLTDLSIYGCAIDQSTPCRFQSIQSGGLLASLTIRDVFVYAPYSTMSANVSFLQFRGAYWGNKLSQAIANSSFTIPAGSIDQVVNSFPSWTPAALDLEQDYVARQVIRVGTFDPN
jgi:hypothetical protein